MFEFLAIFSAVISIFNYVVLIRIFHKIDDLNKDF